MAFNIGSMVTDLGDEAVLFPLACVVAIGFAGLGWLRGALGWVAAIGTMLATVLVLKLGFMACGDAVLAGQIASPSGHTAASAAIYGGLFGILVRALGGPRYWALPGAVGVAAVIGLSRVESGAHTVAETLLGAAIGILGALTASVLTGPPPAGLRVRWIVIVAVVVVAALHGLHLPAEAAIIQFDLPVRTWLACR